jgi:hypothetical protein
VPFGLDSLYMEYGLAEHRAMLTELATRFGGPQPVSINRPTRVELTVQRQDSTGNLLIHLVNYSGQNDNTVDDAIEIHDLEVTLHGVSAISAKALVSETDLAISQSKTCQTLRLSPLGAFEAILISVQ